MLVVLAHEDVGKDGLAILRVPQHLLGTPPLLTQTLTLVRSSIYLPPVFGRQHPTTNNSLQAPPQYVVHQHAKIQASSAGPA